MSYSPYFRAKQFELICLRENAALIREKRFVPVIEPVREEAGPLLRAIDALSEANVQFYVVANPSVGYHASNLSPDFVNVVDRKISECPSAAWLYQIDENAGDALPQWLKDKDIALLHQGSLAARDLSSELKEGDRVSFFGERCSARYRTSINASSKILLEDGFKKRKNADYPDCEVFSELPVTYRTLGATGFGDYLIVGDDYSEGGGAAYAVAIHITYHDPDDDNVVYICHFKSDSNSSPVDPAGKFREAVGKLADHIAGHANKIPRTKAISEFLKLHESGHFPGLGYVKKLSMQHHLEMMEV